MWYKVVIHQGKATKVSAVMQALVLEFIDYITFDDALASETISKYKECLGWFMRLLPNIRDPSKITFKDVTMLKKEMHKRGVGPARINSIIFALRKFLIYCKKVRNMPILTITEIRPMKLLKRQVNYLTKEEVHQLLDSIDTTNIYGLRTRALMETLLGSGMRISEALSLNRDQVDWVNKEALIIGKGGKQRTVFFTDSAVSWLQLYLTKRSDNNQPLFTTFGSGKRLTRFDLSKLFRRCAEHAGVKKKVTPHVLRHTTATIMSQNGADIKYIQEVLGHEDIKTTARYYLGVNKDDLKDKHRKYVKF